MIVKVFIDRDDRMLTYISLIRSYQKRFSIGEIKRRIEQHEAALVFDTYGYDWNDEFTCGLTEDGYLFGFYEFLQTLERHGAALEIRLDDKEGTMEALYQYLCADRELRLELETYPD